ncbi:MAG TPA: hypothetical protein VEA69_24895 [Tepidisphaeraceae bacterium]|nr:hypothetical protein [Tepidisphaeraceae bacterium]
MPLAHYMSFVRGDGASLDRLGGLSTHLPPTWPMSTATTPMAFTAQFACDPARLPIPGAAIVQIYQTEPGIDPWPLAVLIPPGAARNVDGTGRPNHEVTPHDVRWEPRDDPMVATVDDLFDPRHGNLHASKAGGTNAHPDALEPGERFLLQLEDDRLREMHGLNFGGYSLILVLTREGGVEARLA